MKELSEQESKLRMRELLDAFHIYCKEIEIEWFLAYGTLLGAVREGGFIKWDNDIDVFLPYESVRKLMSNPPSDSRFGLKWSHFENGGLLLDRIYFFEKGTFKEVKEDNSFEEGGIYLDGFILYEISSSRVVTFIKSILLRLIQIKRIKESDTREWRWDKRIIYLLIKAVFSPVPKKSVEKWYYNLLVANESQNECYALTEPPHGKADVFPREWFGSATVSFEGEQYPAPREYDLLLKRIYGNYMIPPPIEERGKEMEPVFVEE